ncbi:hypothetical protein, partial [Enterococcus faecium]|uniref:hypothetical protein n=1 Tax=Enterococcus faecium TaxID=1352 RepID=UPI001C7E1600
LNASQSADPRYELNTTAKYKEIFFRMLSEDSGQNAEFTTTSVNGVQKLASAVISPTKRKI